MVALVLPTSVDSFLPAATCLPNITRLVVANMYNVNVFSSKRSHSQDFLNYQ